MRCQRCEKCGTGPVRRVIDSWGPKGDYVFFTCQYGRETWDARPLSSCEEHNWPEPLDNRQSSVEVVTQGRESAPRRTGRAKECSREPVEQALRAAHRELNFVIAPALPVVHCQGRSSQL